MMEAPQQLNLPGNIVAYTANTEEKDLKNVYHPLVQCTYHHFLFFCILFDCEKLFRKTVIYEHGVLEGHTTA
jgi:hypothetical protein